MKASIDDVSLPEALRDLSEVIYYSENPHERDRYGDKIDFCLKGLRVGGYVAVWLACDNPAVELGDQVERFVPYRALDATIHRLWHDYDCESRGPGPPEPPAGPRAPAAGPTAECRGTARPLRRTEREASRPTRAPRRFSRACAPRLATPSRRGGAGTARRYSFAVSG